MDVILQIKEWLVDFISNMDIRLVSYILRVGMILILTSSVLLVTFMHGLRSIFFQILWLIVIISGSFTEYPFKLLIALRYGYLTIAVVISFVCMIFLPGVIAFLLVPKLGYQILLTKIFHALIWSLFVIQILTVILR
jgi:hypothetical protein